MARQDAKGHKARRRGGWGRRLLFSLLVMVSLAVGGIVLLGGLYHGPRTLDQLTRVMPGVPLFPFSEMSAANPGTQRLLALPLYLIRLQGARRAEAVLLTVPADQEFIRDWYGRACTFQDWHLVREEAATGSTRLVYLRQREGLQVLIGPTRGTATGVQVIYLDGLTDRQLADLRGKKAK